MLSATALAQFLGTVYVLIKTKAFCYFDLDKLDFSIVKEMSRYSLPLIPNSLSWWVISVSDRTLLTMFLGVKANGILAVATKFAPIVVNVFAIFNLSWTESVAVHIHDKDGSEYISEISNQCFKLFGAGGMVLIMACAAFFRYLVGTNFSAAYDLIPLLVIGSVLNVLQTLYGIIYIGLKDTKQASRSSIMAAFINITTDLLLIKKIGIYAAPISTICAMLFLSIYRYIDVNRFMRIRIDWKNACVLGILYMTVCLLYHTKQPILIAGGLVMTAMVCVFWNKELVRSMIQTVLQKLRQTK